MKNMAQYIDHTLLKITASENEYLQLFEEAKAHNFFSVCVPPCYVSLAVKALNQSCVKITSVVGFPSGLSTTQSKWQEAQQLIQLGADEIDMVTNLSWVKSNQWLKIQNEISDIKKLLGNRTLKVIVESSLLTKDEILNICLLLIPSGADFIKTSTGFNGPGAQIEDVRYMKEILKSSHVKIKASGGIKTQKKAQDFILAGADRLGTSSSLKIISPKDIHETATSTDY